MCAIEFDIIDKNGFAARKSALNLATHGKIPSLSQEQSGAWATIAIHDTSPVAGSGAAFGEEALKVAATVKLTHALWIIPLALISSLIFKAKDSKISVPWFILLLVLAMMINTFVTLP